MIAKAFLFSYHKKINAEFIGGIYALCAIVFAMTNESRKSLAVFTIESGRFCDVG